MIFRDLNRVRNIIKSLLSQSLSDIERKTMKKLTYVLCLLANKGGCEKHQERAVEVFLLGTRNCGTFNKVVEEGVIEKVVFEQAPEEG